VATVNSFSEGGAVDGGVNGRHKREAELVATLLGQRHADEAAAILGHEVDGFGGDFLGGHGEVAFVFAILIVDEDYHSALPDFLDGFFDSSKWQAHASHVIEKYSLKV
jgi:hypothetical protein